eukprot:357899-Chlamydomonas_euryale.AAC.4
MEASHVAAAHARCRLAAEEAVVSDARVVLGDTQQRRRKAVGVGLQVAPAAAIVAVAVQSNGHQHRARRRCSVGRVQQASIMSGCKCPQLKGRVKLHESVQAGRSNSKRSSRARRSADKFRAALERFEQRVAQQSSAQWNWNEPDEAAARQDAQSTDRHSGNRPRIGPLPTRDVERNLFRSKQSAVQWSLAERTCSETGRTSLPVVARFSEGGWGKGSTNNPAQPAMSCGLNVFFTTWTLVIMFVVVGVLFIPNRVPTAGLLSSGAVLQAGGDSAK